MPLHRVRVLSPVMEQPVETKTSSYRDSHAKLLKLCFSNLCLFGVVYPNEDLRNILPGNAAWWKLARVYTVIVLGMMGLTVVRLVFMFNFSTVFDSRYLIMVFSVLLLVLQIFIQGVEMVRATWSGKKLSKFVSKLLDYVEETHSDARYLRNWTVCILSISWFSTIGTISTVVWRASSSAVDINELLAPHPVYVVYEGRVLTAAIVGLCLNLAYFSAVWCFGFAYIGSVAFIVILQFRKYTSDLEKAVEEDKTLRGRVKAFRQRHQRLCELTELADDLCCRASGSVIFLSSAGLLCQLYYLFASSYDNAAEKAIGIGFVLILFSSATLICIFGGLANHEAHDAKKFLYCCDVQESEMQELQLFLTRLEGSPIGVTAFDLFVIDKPSVLTLLGALVSYFTILISFGSSSPDPSSSAIIPGNTNLTVNATNAVVIG